MISETKILQLAELAKLEFTKEEIELLKKELNQDINNLDNTQIVKTAWEMSNLSRIDGVRFEPSYQNALSIDDLYKKTRSAAFDFETKKKILIGFFVVLEENYENYFSKAWNNNLLEETTLENLREDKPEKSLEVEEIMKKAPKTNGEYFVVPQVVE